MKCINYSIVVLLLTFGFSSAQVDADSLNVAQNDAEIDFINLQDYLPPLSILIDSAIANSPEVQSAQNQLKMQEYNAGVIRKDWANFISFQGQYFYNSIERNTLSDNGLLIPANQTLGYRFGANASIPLTVFYGRKDRVKMAEAQIEAQESELNIRQRMIKEEVINTYNQLLLTQRLVSIMTEAKNSASLILEMSEERFRDGELTIDQLGATTNLKATYDANYEQMRTEFSTTYAKLERLVGVPLSKLKQDER